jgi:hypothetical protein
MNAKRMIAARQESDFICVSVSRGPSFIIEALKPRKRPGVLLPAKAASIFKQPP